MRRGRRRLVAVGVVVAAFVLTILGIELVIRVGRPQPDRVASAARPDAPSGEFEPEVRRNRAGFNDRDRKTVPSPHSFRIAVLGDSFVEAIQVPRERNFLSLTETALNAERPAVVELINLGIPGAGTAVSYQSLIDDALPLHPHAVVLAFDASNDVFNNSPELETKSDKVFFVLENGRLKQHTPEKATIPGGPFGQALWKHSELFRFVARRQDAAQKKAEALRVGAGIPAPLLAYGPPPDDVWQQAWEVTGALLAAMKRETERVGAAFVVVLIPIDIEIDPEAWTRLEQKFPAVSERRLHPLGAHDRVVELCRQRGIPVIDLYDPFARAITEGRRPLHFPVDGHLNETGHRLAADAFAQGFVQTGLIPAVPPLGGSPH